MKHATSDKVVNHDFETDSTPHIFKNRVFRTLSDPELKEEADRRVFIEKSFLVGYEL